MSDVTLNLTSAVYQYLLNHSLREPDVLSQLRAETHQHKSAVMQISPEQGQFMALLLKLLQAKKTIDIGTYTGYSALVAALALPEDGKVVACDIDERWTSIGKKYWQQAGMAHKID